MDQVNDKLTDEQRAQLRPAIDKIADAFAELNERLDALGWEEGDYGCNVCGCEGFTMPPGTPSLKCAQPGCGHYFTQHRVR